MNLESLLRSKRTPTLLVQKPSLDAHEFWDVELLGLHHDQIKSSVSEFRSQRQKAGEKISQPSLKNSDLLDNVAVALGARSYKHWLHEVEPALEGFINQHGLRQPADLIRWENAPFMSSITARQIADRFFNSGHQIPKRLFTGVGNFMFAASGYGRIDLFDVGNRLTGKTDFAFLPHAEHIKFGTSFRDQVVLRAHRHNGWSANTPDYLDLTAQGLVLQAFDDLLSCSINLLGDSLVVPMVSPMELQLYKASEEDKEEHRQLFNLFRDEIERTEVGWVDVLPFNENLVFLRATDGRFDWVVRDQREAPFSRNDLFPIFRSNELPEALDGKSVQAFLHYQKGIWLDQIKHQAEHHHYNSGGTLRDYPGQNKIVERYLAATEGHKPTNQPRAASNRQFTAHTLADKCLMVSDLISIAEFQKFFEAEWQTLRDEKAAFAERNWSSLPSMNALDPANLPVCLNWYDAIAYCKYLEKEEGLPVRMLSIEEWQAIAPSRETIKALGSKAQAHVVEAVNLDGELLEPPTYSIEYITRFKDDPCWVRNEQGLEFLSSLTFGEWLGDYKGSAPDNVWAPVACTASGIALGRGPLEREFFEAWYIGKNNHLKVGFRVCYVADLSS
jgi:hypothetical protein